MSGVIVSLLLCSISSGSHASLLDFVRFENDPGDAVKPKQPLLLGDRGGRFLRFDTKDTEIELELGVAVPFLKIPLAASAGGGSEHNGPPDHRVSVNPAGLLVGATILFSSFLLIPWVLPGSPAHHKRRVDDNTLDGGRSGAWGIIKEVEELLNAQNLNPRSCPQKAICLLGQHVHSAIPMFFDAILSLQGIKEVVEASGIFNAARSGDCEAEYPTCMISSQDMTVIPRLLGLS